MIAQTSAELPAKPLAPEKDDAVRALLMPFGGAGLVTLLNYLATKL